tara:strand:- start:588 stop:974 length:387 start_codon:yes stop_codon:yes gene_type:complete
MRWLILLAALTLAGCSAFTNVSVSDLRDEKHHIASGSIPLTIEQIQQEMYDYSTNCRDIGRLSINPANKNEASFVRYMMGATTDSALLLIDLKQQGNVTEYQGYVYYGTWKRHLENDIKVMSGTATCD